MVVRRRAWLTREGWYYLAVLAFIMGGAILRSVNLLVVLAGTMLAPLLFNWRLVMASLMGLAVRRNLPEQILAGEPLTVEIEVHNSRRWMSSWLMTVEDRIVHDNEPANQRAVLDAPQSRVGGPRPWWERVADEWRWRKPRRSVTRAAALLPHVPAGGRATGTYRVTLFRRGRYRFGPLRVATRFPLGLVSGHFTLPLPGRLVVSPRLGRLLPEWTALLEAELAGEERRQAQRGTNEGDYYGLRPWQSGDSLRWVHWRTTAKLARPIVRQYERRRGRDVALVLDPWLPERPSEQDEGRAELAISLVATAINDITRRGHSLLTIAISVPDSPCYHGPASDLFCRELLARLAELPPGGRAAIATAWQQAQAAAPRGARFIVISSRSASDASLQDGAAQLPLDPDVLTWIDTGSEELERLFVLDAMD